MPPGPNRVLGARATFLSHFRRSASAWRCKSGEAGPSPPRNLFCRRTKSQAALRYHAARPSRLVAKVKNTRPPLWIRVGGLGLNLDGSGFFGLRATILERGRSAERHVEASLEPGRRRTFCHRLVIAKGSFGACDGDLFNTSVIGSPVLHLKTSDVREELSSVSCLSSPAPRISCSCLQQWPP